MPTPGPSVQINSCQTRARDVSRQHKSTTPECLFVFLRLSCSCLGPKWFPPQPFTRGWQHMEMEDFSLPPAIQSQHFCQKGFILKTVLETNYVSEAINEGAGSADSGKIGSPGMWDLYLNTWRITVGKRALHCAQWHDQHVRSTVGMTVGSHGDHCPYSADGRWSWWPPKVCALWLGICTWIFKTSYRKKSSIRWNSTTWEILFLTGCDPCLSRALWCKSVTRMLPTRNIRLAHVGRWAGEDGSRPCEVPPCGQIDSTALYLGRWLLMGEKPKKEGQSEGSCLLNG